MTVTLDEAARAMQAIAPEINPSISKWSIDSRTIEPGAMYFALAGENHDGHKFLADVAAKGASAAAVRTGTAEQAGLPLLHVPDTLEALTDLAKAVRAKFTGTVIGVTGSAGKTTTKDIIWSLLSVSGLTGRTEGNFNNHIGVPLTILRQPEGAMAHVIELAMNHGGEIRHLCAIARPQIGVVTNIGFAHVENFVDISEIAAAKRELIESLPRTGVAVLNADDERVAQFAKSHPGRSITYGIEHDANVRAEAVAFSEDGVRFRVGRTELRSRVTGRHAVLNILAGIAVAGELGASPSSLKEAIAQLEPGKMRGERVVHNGVEIINDCYNANPEAMLAMLDVLAARAGKPKIAVLGEMRELGNMSEELHARVGAHAEGAGIDYLIGVRGAAAFMVAEAVKQGMSREAAFFVETPEEAGEKLKQIAGRGAIVLMKGSRGTRVELALERFLT